MIKKKVETYYCNKTHKPILERSKVFIGGTLILQTNGCIKSTKMGKYPVFLKLLEASVFRIVEILDGKRKVVTLQILSDRYSLKIYLVHYYGLIDVIPKQ